MIIMEYVFHGSKTSNLKTIEPQESTHGNYVYANFVGDTID